MPVYAGGTGTNATQWNTSIRLIHRIPSAGLVISSLIQALWIQADQPIGYSNLPIALLGRNGIQTPLSPTEAILPEYKNYERGIAESRLLKEQRPPLFLINLRLNKEFSPGRGFAFYVNNLPNHRPLYQSVRSETYSQRNITLFFGAELFFQLKSI